MKKDNFFVTTPIYYTNGIPHIGHAYSSIIADVLFNYNKISGKNTKFSTGVDENSQKAVLKAQENGLEVVEYLDKMAEIHKGVWDGLGINYTDFIRTTDEKHHRVVREVLQKSFDKGDIYEHFYEGKYCVGCEAFKKEDDLIEKNGLKVCPDHLTKPDELKEKNYFFKLSKYQKWMEGFYEAKPDFVKPSDRFNEVIAFVKRGLEDFSISRETNKFGIKLPFDESQVTYVWYDALFNYYTVCRENSSGGDDLDFWPPTLHVVGKDIIRFHAIYWPAMIASAFDLGEEVDGEIVFRESDLDKLPQNILTTGFFTIDGQKISKSLGNVIDPVEFSEQYSKDVLTLYLLSAFNIGQDGDFDIKDSLLMFNAKLANNLGNLVNRVVVLSLKLKVESGRLEGKSEINQAYSSVLRGDFIEKIKMSFNDYNLKNILDESFKFLDDLNKFADTTEPWKIIKDEEREEEVREVLYTLAEGIRQVGLVLYPFFPDKMDEMFNKMGLGDYKDLLEIGKLNELIDKKQDFLIKEKGSPLFMRFDI